MKKARTRRNRLATEITIVFAASIALVVPAVGQIPLDTQVSLAESLLPPSVRGEAKIVVRDADSEVVVREGDGFICVSDSTRSDQLSLNCHSKSLREQVVLEREITAEGLRGEAFRRRVCQQAEARGIVAPSGAMEISVSLEVGLDGSLPGGMTVYYLLWLPRATTASIGLIDVNPHDDSPWLHMEGTCRAHVMWYEKRPNREGLLTAIPSNTPSAPESFDPGVMLRKGNPR